MRCRQTVSSYNGCAEAIGFIDADGRRVVVAYHQLGDTFPIGTLRAMITDAGWQDEDLRRLKLID
jgi:hypothetical protein